MSKQKGGAAVMNAIPGKPIWALLVAAVICLPCFAEAQPANGAKVVAQLGCGGAVAGEGLSKSGMQHVAPKIGESGGVDGGAKIGCGVSQASLATSAPGKVGAEARQKNGTNDAVRVGEEGFNHFQFWLIVVIALFPLWRSVYLSGKHNVM